MGAAPHTLWLDALRLTRSGNCGFLSSSCYVGNLPGAIQLPTLMQAGHPASYRNAIALRIVDSAGGGAIVQGRAKGFYGYAIQASTSRGDLSVVGDATRPISMSVGGDNSGFLYAGIPFAVANITFKHVDCTYGPGVDCVNRMYAAAGIKATPYTGNIEIGNCSFTNVPEEAIWIGSNAAYSATSGLTVNLHDLTIGMNAVITQCYAISLGSVQNLTIRDCNISGQGWGLALYPANGPLDIENGCVNITMTGLNIDLSFYPEREGGWTCVNSEQRVLKFKTVSPGPFSRFSNILVADSSFTSRVTDGYAPRSARCRTTCATATTSGATGTSAS